MGACQGIAFPVMVYALHLRLDRVDETAARHAYRAAAN